MLAGSVRALLRRAYLLAPALVAATLPAQTRGANARARGRADAPVTVYEMSDFQCPFCRQFTLDALPEIERDFIRTGKVRWVFVAYPLLRIHKNAEAAAEFALCAARQNRFWEVHDLLFRHQPDWADLDGPERVFLRLADSARLNRAALTTCVNAHATRGEVASELRMSQRAGATATPSFWIEGGILEGAVPFPVFKQVLDSIYRIKTAPHPSAH
ncbi:MAG TPA: thioredoxin domain-containing protein [Gemmatimonadales bacterium]